MGDSDTKQELNMDSDFWNEYQRHDCYYVSDYHKWQRIERRRRVKGIVGGVLILSVIVAVIALVRG
jgi:hypothetical protein